MLACSTRELAADHVDRLCPRMPVFSLPGPARVAGGLEIRGRCLQKLHDGLGPQGRQEVCRPPVRCGVFGFHDFMTHMSLPVLSDIYIYIYIYISYAPVRTAFQDMCPGCFSVGRLGARLLQHVIQATAQNEANTGLCLTERFSYV